MRWQEKLMAENLTQFYQKWQKKIVNVTFWKYLLTFEEPRRLLWHNFFLKIGRTFSQKWQNALVRLAGNLCFDLEDNVHSFIHSFNHSFLHWLIPSFLHSIIQSFIHSFIHPLIHSSVADPDPGSGAFLTPGSGMGRSQHPDPGSGMNNPDHIF